MHPGSVSQVEMINVDGRLLPPGGNFDDLISSHLSLASLRVEC